MITHEADDDNGLVHFYFNGNEVCTWTYEDEDELNICIETFNKIYNLGRVSCIATLEELLEGKS